MSETQNKPTTKVVIVPCSGIGKTYGTVSREAAYDLTEDLRPETPNWCRCPCWCWEMRLPARPWLTARRSPLTAASWPAPRKWCRRAAARWLRILPCWMCTGAIASSNLRASPS